MEVREKWGRGEEKESKGEMGGEEVREKWGEGGEEGK